MSKDALEQGSDLATTRILGEILQGAHDRDDGHGDAGDDQRPEQRGYVEATARAHGEHILQENLVEDDAVG